MEADHFWVNFFEMVEDMHRHVLAGETVTRDDSVTRRVIGFCSLLHRWDLPLTAAKMCHEHSDGSLKHRERVMTVQELIELLMEYDHDASVRIGDCGDIALQPHHLKMCMVDDMGDVYESSYGHYDSIHITDKR